MQNPTPLRRLILDNLFWLGVSLVLAFVVWVIAVTQTDPPTTWREPGVPIRLTPAAGLIITNTGAFPSTAVVELRAPSSERAAVQDEDIIVWANLADLPPGEHIVPLQNSVAAPRTAVAGVSPRQITVELEVEAAQLKPVEVEITSQPPLVYTADEPVLDVRQVEVRGPASLVEDVASVRVAVALEGLRAPYVENVRAVPVDADGDVVSGVTVAPELVNVQIDIQQRSDLREVRVQPNIVGELPEGYILTPNFDWEPKTAVVTGPAEILNALPGTIFTEPITLSDKTSSFDVIVPLQLPNSSILVVTGRTVTVSVGITALTVSRQFDRIPIELIGRDPALNYELTADVVTVLVTGPQPLLDTLTTNEISVLIDVSGLEAGETLQAVPVASFGDNTDAVTASVLPAQIDITVGSLVPLTPEVTPQASG